MVICDYHEGSTCNIRVEFLHGVYNGKQLPIRRPEFLLRLAARA